MGEIRTATLDGNDLPLQFHYEPASPVRRTSLKRTAGGVVRQVASTIMDADTLVSWSCEACSQAEWQQFQDWFNNAADPTFAFVGYWGDVYNVKFHALDPPRVRSRLFDVSGSFQIVDVTAWHE